ncbi:hypothetical protein MMC22_006883 [Lobaria immixta]|nr:hypothetical protein [Lobaria immixta]
MSLNTLPPEITGFVVANLASQPTSLRHLARCSRKLYHCAVPHLYRHVTVQEVIRKGEQQDGQLKKLASLLIRRPDLAGLVRHFTVRITRTHPLEAEYWEAETHVRPNLVNLDQAFKFSQEEKINCLGQFSRTHQSHHDFILALLLPALLKVENLVIDVDNGSRMREDYGTYYLEQMIQKAARTERPFDVQPPFEALTGFAHSQKYFNSRSTGFIALLLKLPAIQKISGCFQSTWDPDLGGSGVTDKNLIELDSSSSPVINLDLVNYKLSRVDLGHMLRAPKALKIFCNRVRPYGFDFTDIRDALTPQKNCLEILVLNSFDLHNVYRRNHAFEPMTSFISFNALKVFKSAASFLVRTENGAGRHSLINIFPPNLETLHLTRLPLGYGVGHVLAAVEHLLARKSPQQIPSLKKLILEEAVCLRAVGAPAHLVDILWDNTQETVPERLRSVAAAHGVSIDVIENRRNDPA